MSAASAVRAGRRAAEATMLDTCVIRRAGAPTTNPTTGVVTRTWTDIYTGPCKVQESGGFASTAQAPEAGEHAYAVSRYVLHVPTTVTDAADGDMVTITAAALDPSLVGRQYRLDGEFAKTLATARRFQVEETTS